MTRALRALIARNTDEAPTEPGVYRLPCGSYYVDYFVTAEGEECWLVPGDETSYTRENVAVDRHGDYPWVRLYTLAEAAVALQSTVDHERIALSELAERLKLEERSPGDADAGLDPDE